MQDIYKIYLQESHSIEVTRHGGKISYAGEREARRPLGLVINKKYKY